MHKMSILLKASLIDGFSANKILVKSGFGNKRGSSRQFLLMALLAATLGYIVYFIGWYYWIMAEVLQPLGMLEDLLMMIALAGSVLSFFMALYKAPGYLYASKDFNMLAALPVKPSSILGSKLAAFYITGFLPCLGLTLPGLVVYGIKTGAGPVFYAAGILATLVLPLVPMVIGALIAFPIMYIGTRFRHRAAVTLVLYLFLAIALIVGSYAIPLQTAEQMEAGATAISGMARFYPPATLFTDALYTNNVTSWLLLLLISLATPALAIMFFARAYMHINSALSERRTRGDFKLRQVSVSGVFGALLGKEAKLFFSSTVYVLNTAIGVVLFTIYIVAMAIMGFEDVAAIFLGIPNGAEFMLSITAIVGMFCIGMCTVTAASISMEGSSFWVIKTLPVRFWDIAKAKIALNLLVTVPLSIVNMVILLFITDIDMSVFFGIILAMSSFAVFIAAAGLLVNLYFPKLDWKNPTQAVKQSASVLVAILTAFGAIALCVVVYIATNLTLTTFAFTAAAFFGVLSLGLLFFLYTKGEKLFNRIF